MRLVGKFSGGCSAGLRARTQSCCTGNKALPRFPFFNSKGTPFRDGPCWTMFVSIPIHGSGQAWFDCMRHKGPTMALVGPAGRGHHQLSRKLFCVPTKNQQTNTKGSGWSSASLSHIQSRRYLSEGPQRNLPLLVASCLQKMKTCLRRRARLSDSYQRISALAHRAPGPIPADAMAGLSWGDLKCSLLTIRARPNVPAPETACRRPWKAPLSLLLIGIHPRPLATRWLNVNTRYVNTRLFCLGTAKKANQHKEPFFHMHWCDFNNHSVMAAQCLQQKPRATAAPPGGQTASCLAGLWQLGNGLLSRVREIRCLVANGGNTMVGGGGWGGGGGGEGLACSARGPFPNFPPTQGEMH